MMKSNTSLTGVGHVRLNQSKLTTSDYPSYELFTETLRAGIFGKDTGRQLRLVVGPDRKVQEVIRI